MTAGDRRSRAGQRVASSSLSPLVARRRPPAPRGPDLPRVEHGGPDFAEMAALGIRPDAIFDFNVNKKPLGASPRALRALGLGDPAAYPDARCLRLRGGFAPAPDVQPRQGLAGNGSGRVVLRPP